MRKKTIEDYLEIIYILQNKAGKVKTSDISSAFNISPASVTEIFKKLSDDNYINYEKYSGVLLTRKGEKIAIETKRKHNILKKFLIIIGIGEDAADEEACKIEHIVDLETIKRLSKFVKFLQKSEEETRWLDHFEHFYKTGEYTQIQSREHK